MQGCKTVNWITIGNGMEELKTEKKIFFFKSSHLKDYR
jgi:hypothetical protein